MIGKPRLTLIAGFVAMVVLVASAGWVLWSSFERSKEASLSVEHTYRVLIGSQRFLSTIREAESSLRAYVIVRNANYLVPYRQAVADQAKILNDLQRLTYDSPEQQANLKIIRDLTAQRLQILADGEKNAANTPPTSAITLVSVGKGPKIMADLTAQVSLFEEGEHRLLAQRNEAAEEAVSWTRALLILTSMLLAAVLLLASRAIERFIVNREAAHEALQRQADLIDFSHDAIVTLNPEGAITGWNAGAAELYGWSSAEALGHQLHGILKTTGAGVFAQISESLGRTGRWEGELEQTTRDGQSRLVDSRYVQVRNRAGEPVGALNISRDETQRKQAEELLRQVAEQRRLALDAAELGAWDYSVEQDSVTWDERCRDMMGLPGLGPAKLAQALKVVHPEERELMHNLARRTMAGASNGRFSQELRIVMKDGSVRWLTTYGRVYFEEREGSRQPVRVIGVNRDVTERKNVQAALRESDDKLRVALETGRIGIFNDLADESKILFDERARRLLGFDLERDVSTAEFFARLHPDDRDKFRNARAHDLETPSGDLGEIDYRILLPSGEVRWLVARRRVYFSGEGDSRRAVRILGVLLDITEQKRAEHRLTEALAQSDNERRRLGVILETMPAGVMLADRNNVVLEVNAQALRIWGATEDARLANILAEKRGRRPDTGEVLQLADWPRARAVLGETVLGEMIDIERFDGSKATVFNAASPVRDAQGSIQGAVSVMVDITEQRQVELALRRSEESLRAAHSDLERLLEQKDILFQEVQHRVKNNLQIVSSLLSLEAQRFQDSAFHNALNESRDRIRSMALMHEKFYHLDDLARIDFSDYVDELARYFFSSYIADPSAVGFASNVDAKLKMAEAIPCGLILQELLSNSVKHAFPDGKGEIRIEFHLLADDFQLCYWDSGVGLPAIVNLDKPASLGLQLVTDLAAQLHGKIAYEYNQGAQFTLTFASAAQETPVAKPGL